MSSVPSHQALDFYCPVNNDCFLVVLRRSFRFIRFPRLFPDPSLTHWPYSSAAGGME
jgi:hypothetical protein